MTERKWTKGPWQWRNHPTEGIDGVIEPYTCQGEGFVEVSEGNAHLISAAPDLYEALEHALDCWEEHCKHGYNMQGDWVHDAREALAKARGEQQ
jgi:hypothetical protein